MTEFTSTSQGIDKDLGLAADVPESTPVRLQILPETSELLEQVMDITGQSAAEIMEHALCTYVRGNQWNWGKRHQNTIPFITDRPEGEHLLLLRLSTAELMKLQMKASSNHLQSQPVDEFVMDYLRDETDVLTLLPEAPYRGDPA